MKWEIRSLPNVIFALPVTSYTVLPVIYGETSSMRSLSWFIIVLIFAAIIALLFKAFPEKGAVLGGLSGILIGALLLKLDYLPLTILGVLIYGTSLFIFMFRRKAQLDVASNRQVAE